MTDIDRLVEVRGASIGSGFLIADGLILTAWHLLRPTPGDAPASSLPVRIERDISPGDPLENAEQSATLLWPLEEDPGHDFDFALLAVQASESHQLEPVPWASLPQWGSVDVTAVGYPDVAIDWNLTRRDSRGISGWIESADNVRGLSEGRGTLTMRMRDEDAPDLHPADAWPGMSGAAVFAGHVLIGIVHIAGKEGDRHQLRVLPVDRLFAREDVVQALARSGRTVPPHRETGEPAAAQTSSWNWPRPWDFSGYIAEKREGFVGRDWLFDEVRKWYEDANGSQALLVCADFGVGKSAFMAELTVDAHGLQIPAYHFCTHYVKATLNPATFVKSVAAQLAASLPAYRLAVEADPDARRWLEEAQLDPGSAFERAIVGPLHAIDPPGVPQVVLVDALDEALDFAITSGSRSAATIVRLLANQAKHLPAWLRILATSRRIQEVVQPIQTAFRCETPDGEDARNLDDIRFYVAGRCSGATLASVLEKGHKNAGEIAAMLSDARRSGGKFLYAVRVLNDVETGALALDRINDLPPGMDGFYLDAFERRFPANEDFAPAGALLSVLCVQREPMSRAELVAILGTPDTQVGKLLKRIEDFLRIRARRYAFDHLSVAQWLSEENEEGFARADRFSVDLATAEGRIAAWATRELTADRAHESAYLARHLGAYLNPQERKVQFARLLPDFRWLDARLRAVGINALLTDFADVDETPALAALERALRQSAHVLGHDGSDWAGPDLLAPQILGRLQSRPEAELHALCAQAAEALKRSAELRPMTDSLRLAEALLRTLEGHTGHVNALAGLADGRFASGSGDKTIRLWNRVSGVCEAVLEGHTDEVAALTVLVDGRLASGSADKAIMVWNRASGVCERMLEGHKDSVRAFAVLADGRLASGSRDRTIKLWNLASGVCEATLEGHTGPITGLAVLADGRLASASADRTIRLWNPASGAWEATIEGHALSVSALAVLADGRLVSASDDKTIKLWNPVSGACEATLEGHTDRVSALAVLADGRLASGSRDTTIRLWNPAGGECEATLEGHTDRVSALAMLADGRLASGSADRTVRLWNPASRVGEATLERHSDLVSGLAVLADGRFASCSHDKTVRLWNPVSGACEATLAGQTGPIIGFVVLSDGRLASRSRESTAIRLWNLASVTCEMTLIGHTFTVLALAVLRDGRIASGSHDNTIRLWNTVSGMCERTLAETGPIWRPVSALAVLGDGRLASGSEDARIRLWNPASGVCEATLEGHSKKITGLTVLTDGRLASWSKELTIRVWNPATGECEATLEGHRGPISTLAELADGRLVSASDDKTIKLWNPATGECEATLEGHADRVSALAVLADGRFASGSFDNTIRVWQERNGRWAAVVQFVADAGICTLAFATRAWVLAAGDVRGRVHLLKGEPAASAPK